MRVLFSSLLGAAGAIVIYLIVMWLLGWGNDNAVLAVLQGVTLVAFLWISLTAYLAREKSRKAELTHLDAAEQLQDARLLYIMGSGSTLGQRLAEKKTMYPKGDARNEEL